MLHTALAKLAFDRQMIPFESLRSDFLKAANVLSAAGESLKFELNAPATASKIEECERILRCRLSTSHTDFLRVANGALVDQSNEGTIRILSTDEILSKTRDMRSTAFAIGRSQNFVRARKLITVADYEDGNYCVIETVGIGEGAILDAFHELPAKHWVQIATSFAEWMSLIFRSVINGKGITYWL